MVSGNWNEGANWSSGNVPGTGEYVLVPAGAPYALEIPAGLEVTVKSLELEPDAAMNVRTGGKVNVEK